MDMSMEGGWTGSESQCWSNITFRNKLTESVLIPAELEPVSHIFSCHIINTCIWRKHKNTIKIGLLLTASVKILRSWLKHMTGDYSALVPPSDSPCDDWCNCRFSSSLLFKAFFLSAVILSLAQEKDNRPPVTQTNLKMITIRLYCKKQKSNMLLHPRQNKKILFHYPPRL